MSKFKLRTEDGLCQFVLFADLLPAFERWVDDQGFYLYPIPVEDDLPTYAVAAKERQ